MREVTIMVRAIDSIADVLLRRFVPTTKAAAVRCVVTKIHRGHVCGFAQGYVSYMYTRYMTCYPSNGAPYERVYTQCEQ